MPDAWACSIYGYHPESTGQWCAAGCGRDYNRMERVEPPSGAAPIPEGDSG